MRLNESQKGGQKTQWISSPFLDGNYYQQAVLWVDNESSEESKGRSKGSMEC
jgi:hypothetical protein